MIEFDKDTGQNHESPIGLKHQSMRKKNKVWYAEVRMRHYIIKLHQELYPELAEKMEKDPKNATIIYTCFLAMLPLELKGVLTSELKSQILKTYGLLK